MKRREKHARDQVGAKPARPSITAPARRLPARSFLFRLIAAVVFPCLLLCLLESGLRLAGYGYPSSFFVPYTKEGKRVYVENQQFGWRFFDPGLARTPQPVVLEAPKPTGVFRIFVFGGSAAFGDPQPDFGLPRMLEVVLRARYPGARFEVINAAMTAINSHVVLPIARDCARREGDLWVIYLGNNEVVGPFGSGTVFGRQALNLALIRGATALKATRTGELMAELLRKFKGVQSEASEWGGMAMFLKNTVRQDDSRLGVTYSQFERNLQDILKLGLSHRVKLVLSTVGSNLRDCAPFASEHRPGLTDGQKANWERLYQSGYEQWREGDFSKALEFLQQAAQTDDRFADLQFLCGTCCLQLQRFEEAQRHLRLARDYDALRFRADTRINEIIRRVGSGREREGILLCDGEQMLARKSTGGLPGQDLLYDHVHLTFEGNYLEALAVAKQIAKLLPPEIARLADAAQPWPSAEACALRLGWTDWNRFEATADMMRRVNDPPFTSQLSHREQCASLRAQMERLAPAAAAPSLARYLVQYQQTLKSATNDWVLYQNLARLEEKMGDLERAAEAWNHVIQLVPQSGQPRTALGLLWIQLGHPDKAVRELEAALALTPRPRRGPALNALGLALAAEKRFPDAIREYQKALQLSPDSPESHLNLGVALSAIGQTNSAREHLRQALKKRPNDAGMLVQFGKMCVSQGWLDEALTNFTQALVLDPTDATAHFCLGGTMALLHHSDQARDHYAEAVRLRPDFTVARLGLGIELGREGRHQEAVEQFAEAVKLSPQLLEARLNLGIALAKTQRDEEAILQFEKALKMDPGNALARRYLDRLRTVK